MRWRRNSRASAGMPINRRGNRPFSIDLGLIGIESESQRSGSDERNEIVLPLPGRSLAQRRHQFIVGLCPRRRAGTILQRSGDKDHGIAGHRKLALTGLAPQVERRLAVVADLQRRKPISSPNGNPSSARAGMTWKPAAATITASAACLTEFVADNIHPSKFYRRSRPRAVLADDPPKCQRFGEKIMRIRRKKSPRAVGRGDFVCFVRAGLISRPSP